jgi:hypothetical protein
MQMYQLRHFLKKYSTLEHSATIIRKYTEIYGSVPESFQGCAFYDYLSSYKALPYKTPEYLQDFFDWNLLFQLIAASLYSDYDFVFQPDSFQPDLRIFVNPENTDKKTSSFVSELDGKAIARLFEIYLSEQFFHQVVAVAEGETEELALIRTEKHDTFLRKKAEAELIILLNENICKFVDISCYKTDTAVPF